MATMRRLHLAPPSRCPTVAPLRASPAPRRAMPLRLPTRPRAQSEPSDVPTPAPHQEEDAATRRMVLAALVSMGAAGAAVVQPPVAEATAYRWKFYIRPSTTLTVQELYNDFKARNPLCYPVISGTAPSPVTDIKFLYETLPPGVTGAAYPQSSYPILCDNNITTPLRSAATAFPPALAKMWFRCSPPCL